MQRLIYMCKKDDFDEEEGQKGILTLGDCGVEMGSGMTPRCP